MIVSNNSKRSNCRWLQICVLVCVVVVLPLGIASAADHEAVAELTPQQARAMMGVLKKAGGDKKDVDIDAIGRKIRAAVQAGKITAEEGRAKMVAVRKAAGGEKKTAKEGGCASGEDNQRRGQGQNGRYQKKKCR
ncbi:MAG: hypothetical protein ACYSU3_23605 [Planctomycetota bacterium]